MSKLAAKRCRHCKRDARLAVTCSLRNFSIRQVLGHMRGGVIVPPDLMYCRALVNCYIPSTLQRPQLLARGYSSEGMRCQRCSWLPTCVRHQTLTVLRIHGLITLYTTREQ